ncbi:MAG: hypothetical protein JSS11_14570 [Verrucomicrobia bacterium]|nr:hypothetical protein [Verrucomicrobiota bacterium]
MEMPNTMESVTPGSGEYSCRTDLRLNAWLFAATVTYGITLYVLKHEPEWSPRSRGLFALTPLLPGLMYLRDCARFIRGLDELQRCVQMAALLFAALGTLFAQVVLATLGAQGMELGSLAHGLGLGQALMLLFALWLVGWGVANRRYK